jgi:hypothetical protein
MNCELLIINILGSSIIYMVQNAGRVLNPPSVNRTNKFPTMRPSINHRRTTFYYQKHEKTHTAFARLRYDN